jgi:hypothetical protein
MMMARSSIDRLLWFAERKVPARSTYFITTGTYGQKTGDSAALSPARPRHSTGWYCAAAS